MQCNDKRSLSGCAVANLRALYSTQVELRGGDHPQWWVAIGLGASLEPGAQSRIGAQGICNYMIMSAGGTPWIASGWSKDD